MMNTPTRNSREALYYVTSDAGELSPYAQAASLTELALTLINHLHRRSRYLPDAVFEDPQWLMTLELFVAGEQSRAVSVSSLCLSSGVPPTTALRHVRMLEAKGFFERVAHPRDRRISHLRLSEGARDQVERYLNSIRSSDTEEEEESPPLRSSQ
jgi:DNA-binding MarR family transcriptional regulator